jgi:hypothetical protein
MQDIRIDCAGILQFWEVFIFFFAVFLFFLEKYVWLSELKAFHFSMGFVEKLEIWSVLGLFLPVAKTFI